MYSLISMRIMACSSSNNSRHRLRATSVLPTPVGPRKRKEPIGRLVSLRPARERRMALATAATARSWPITWRPIEFSSLVNLLDSLSISRSTGMPVQRATTLAMSSGVTSSRSKRSAGGIAASSWRAAASFFSNSGKSPYLMRLAVARSASRSAISSCERRLSIFSVAVLTVWRISFSCCHLVSIALA